MIAAFWISLVALVLVLVAFRHVMRSPYATPPTIAPKPSGRCRTDESERPSSAPPPVT